MQSQKRAGLGAERLEEECMGLVLVSGRVRRTTPSQSLGRSPSSITVAEEKDQRLQGAVLCGRYHQLSWIWI